MPEALLFTAVAALSWCAALRVAARCVGGGWPRIAAASALFGAGALFVPLAAGVTGLGTSPMAFAALSLLVAGSGAWAAGPPALGVVAETAGQLARASRAQRIVAGAVGGAGAGLLVAQVLAPSVRTDGFHLTEVVRWLHGGRPGSVELVIQEWPAGAYPLVNDLAITWSAGLARSFAPVSIWAAALTFLLAGSLYWLLRARGVDWAAASLGTAALTLTTVTTSQFDGASSDLSSVAWLACGVALVAAPDPARRYPGPAILALGLAAGTKTTTVLIGAVVLVVAVWPARHRLRRADLAWAGAALLAAGAWPLRNLLDHGNPLWPFARPAGIGDPLPYILSDLQTTFLDRPLDSLAVFWEYWNGNLVRMSLLVAGGVVLALIQRRRDASVAAGLAVAGLLVWMTSPITGKPPVELGNISHASLRYALPVVLAGGVALMLSARPGERGGRLALALAGLSCALALQAVPLRMFTSVEAFLLAGPAAIGAGAIAALLAGSQGLRTPRPLAVTAGAVLLLAAGTLVGTDRFVTRDGQFVEVLRWLDAQPEFRSGSAPVVMNWRPDGRFSGPRLQHDIVLLPTDSSCADVTRRLRTDWVVVWQEASVPVPPARPAPGPECLRAERPRYADPFFLVYHRGP